MNKVNTIALDRTKYTTEEGFKKALGNIIYQLLDLDYIIVARYEDAGIYIIEFDHADESIGCPHPRWLTEEQLEQVSE